MRALEERYGVVGRVAARYVAAGLHVTLNHPTRYGPATIVVQGAGQRLVVEVAQSPKEAYEKADLLVKKAGILKAKPVLAVYGNYDIDASEFQRKGVQVKWISPG